MELQTPHGFELIAPEREHVPIHTLPEPEIEFEQEFENATPESEVAPEFAWPWPERLGWVIYRLEADMLDSFRVLAEGEAAADLRDERFRWPLICAMRLGPHFTVAEVSRAASVPRPTISSWRARKCWFDLSLTILETGPEICFSLPSAQAYADLSAFQSFWPIPRRHLVAPVEPETQAEARVREWFNKLVPAELRASGERQPVVTGAPLVLSEEQADAAYRLADRHHRCHPPCDGPHEFPEEDPT